MDLPSLLAEQRKGIAATKQRSQQRIASTVSSTSPLAARIEKHRDKLKSMATPPEAKVEGSRSSAQRAAAITPPSSGKTVEARVSPVPTPDALDDVPQSSTPILSAVSAPFASPDRFFPPADGLKFTRDPPSATSATRTSRPLAPRPDAFYSSPQPGLFASPVEAKRVPDDVSIRSFASHAPPATPQPAPASRSNVRCVSRCCCGVCAAVCCVLSVLCCARCLCLCCPVPFACSCYVPVCASYVSVSNVCVCYVIGAVGGRQCGQSG